MKAIGDAARDRARPLRTLVNTEERVTIEARAKASGLTVSAFLRAAALGVRPRLPPVTDLQAVGTLARVNADQARLGNLMKLYLTEAKPDHAAANRLMADIQTLQDELKRVVRKVAV